MMKKQQNMNRLADVLLERQKKDPPRLVGSSTPGGPTDIETRITRLPTPIGNEDDVLTVFDDGGDLVPAWKPPASASVAELDDIGDVNASTPSNGDVLTWDSTPGEWVNSPPAAGYTDEQVRDVVGATLVAGNNIDITVSDGSDTITIDVEALTSVDITDFNTAVDERARDAVGIALVAGNNIDITVNDAGDTITIDVEALTESDIAGLVSDLASLSSSSHAALTIADTATVNLTLVGQLLSADVISPLIISEASSPGTPAATTAELRLDSGTNGIQTLTWKSDEAFSYIIGRDEYIIVKNATGGTLNPGTPVYINGVASGVPTVAKAKADDLTTAKVAGVLADSIANNGFGRCFHYGYTSTMDTSGYAAGDTLWLSEATAGALRTTPPSDLNYNVKIGQVLTVGNPGSFLVQLEQEERTIMTTKGDLLTRSSTQNVRQPVGADGEVLKSDSSVTTGVTWVNVNTLISSTADPSFVALTPPINGNFSWINQGSATVSTTDGGIYLAVAAAAGVNVHLRVMNAPATPYVVTALFITNMPTEASGVNGLFWRQSSDGKLASCVVSGTTNIARAQATKYTNPTTFSAVYNSVFLPTYHRIWLRIEDNGTNRICYYSFDGLHFQQFHSVGRTDFLTADQIGFAMDANSALYGQQMWLLSWKIT